MTAYAIRIRNIECIMWEILGAHFSEVLPMEGESSRSLLHKFLAIRVTEGATRDILLTKTRLWREAIHEVGTASFPSKFVEIKINYLAPARHNLPTRVKAPLAVETVQAILKVLS